MWVALSRQVWKSPGISFCDLNLAIDGKLLIPVSVFRIWNKVSVDLHWYSYYEATLLCLNSYLNDPKDLLGLKGARLGLVDLCFFVWKRWVICVYLNPFNIASRDVEIWSFYYCHFRMLNNNLLSLWLLFRFVMHEVLS